MPTLLITGANRGIGLEFVRQYATEGWRIHAGCRRPDDAHDLHALAANSDGRISIHPIAVDEQASVDALASQLACESIDLLINGAGIYFRPESSHRSVNFDHWRQAFEINTLGPMRVVNALLEPVSRSQRKTIVMITSDMGSIGSNTVGYAYEYRTSKAALNALTRNLHIELNPRGLTVVALHPGWVKTDMGGPQAPVEVHDSVAGMRAVIERLTPDDSGNCLDYEGNTLSW